MFEKVFTLRRAAPQRGAMFSMDARIALIIASVLAGVVGTQVIQRIERNKVGAAEQGVAQLMEGLKNYYTTVSLDAIPPGGVADAFNTSTATPEDDFESVILDEGLVTQDNLNTDPWGEVWTYDECQRDATIEGVDVTVHHVVIFSNGPDGVADSRTGDVDDFLTDANCATDYADWRAENDDIGEKFSTFDIERKRVDITRQQINAIREGIGAYESAMFLEAQSECPGSLAITCDFDGVDGYENGEEENYNFFPRSSTDSTTSAKYFIPDGRAVDVTTDEMALVDNTILAEMEAFLEILGLNSALATDPWGRQLCYESNRTERDLPPFSAKVAYVDASSPCPTP